jgi:hypothetical protein
LVGFRNDGVGAGGCGDNEGSVLFVLLIALHYKRFSLKIIIIATLIRTNRKKASIMSIFKEL